jgi:hypothetical protein
MEGKNGEGRAGLGFARPCGYRLDLTFIDIQIDLTDNA